MKFKSNKKNYRIYRKVYFLDSKAIKLHKKGFVLKFIFFLKISKTRTDGKCYEMK